MINSISAIKNVKAFVYNNFDVLFALLLSIFLNIAVRMIEFPLWQNVSFQIGDEYLMATHDAYTWLAGAKGVGRTVADPFSALIRMIHDLTGLKLGTIGFWLPVVMVPFLVIPVCILCRLLRLTEGAVVFSIMAVSSLGFLVRTRLGFCDTDLLTLLLPLTFVCTLIVWLASQTRSPWQNIDLYLCMSPSRAIVVAFLAGIIGMVNISVYHQGGSILLAVLGMAVIIGSVFARGGHRLYIWSGLLVAFALTYGNFLSIILALVATSVVYFKFDLLKIKWAFVVLLIFTLVVMYDVAFYKILLGYVTKILAYAKIFEVTAPSGSASLNLPSVLQSVREAQSLQWLEMMDRVAGNKFIFFLGIAGLIFVGIRRPQLWLLFPFLLLAVASVKLGNRFTMFGGVAIGAGLGLGLAELMRFYNQSFGRQWIAQLILCCFALWPASQMMIKANPAPVLPKIYAQTFLDLRDSTDPDARLWQWWDYGYAGQYYAERITFGDGGKHNGTWLYPLARVHATPSPKQASQLMRYVTISQKKSANTDLPSKYYWFNPVSELEKMGSESATEFMNKLSIADLEFPSDIPPQYFVLSWENLRLASWISYYGNWDLVSGSSSPGKIQQVRGEVRIDSASGSLGVNGKSQSLDSVDIIDDNQNRRFEWANGTGMHLILNQMSKQVFLMDSKLYNSMMVQMLIGDTKSFEPHFELVDDKYPWTRVYRAK
jgi:dolichyl-diphosphooligosaccharide--protein glycosyltransferase